MLMPIVSMNKMAMNESIAVTCCYREVATPTAMYWEVLNGGWIGSGYVTEQKFKDGLVTGVTDFTSTIWYGIPYDITPVAAMNTTTNIPQYGTYWDATLVPPANATGWNVGGTPLASFFSDWKVDKACDHKTLSCAYRTESNERKDNRHFESTTKHDKGGDSWAAPHEAKQYSS